MRIGTLSTVELPGFQRMVTKLNPRLSYQLPSRNYFSHTTKAGKRVEILQQLSIRKDYPVTS